MALAGVPRSIDPDAVEAHLRALPGVARIHDLHIWPMSTTEFALTAHLVMPGGFPGDAFLPTARTASPTVSASAIPPSRSRPARIARKGEHSH